MFDMEQMVETRWQGKNRVWYEDKGYIYTKNLDILKVKAKDLTPKSNAKVEYQCDRCGKTVKLSYNNYTKSGKSMCQPCVATININKRRISFETVEALFKSKGYSLMSNKDEYKNTRSKLRYNCQQHGEQRISYSNLQNGQGCPKCANERNSGNRNSNWKGGSSELNKYLRAAMIPWINQQLQRANYMCEITGKQGILNVHHMFSFKKILDITMEELQLDIRVHIGDYSDDEIQLITVNFIKNNNIYANPIVILENVHREFHRFCGGTNKDTTIEQLKQFKLHWRQ